ncbi:MAG: cobalt-precorrin-5B (C(1))-methyltransferase [Pseudomonadota bacterium]
MAKAQATNTEKNIETGSSLRRGWTTGACATAATKAALTALLTGEFPDPVSILLPKGDRPLFPLAREELGSDFAVAGIVKDAGDDPDVTHGALIVSKVRRGVEGAGICFRAGSGVGIVTKAGLPVPVGEAAINPVPRTLMQHEVEALCQTHDIPTDIEIEISIPEGEQIAQQTWNPRLGIVGGLSILGTTGVVHPFSCSAWIHSIHRGIDVARAAGLNHVIAATGSTSESTAQAIYKLPEFGLLDMGDFAGGVLKYLRNHPVPKITLAGGFAKFTKLAQGALDLHSGRSQVDFAFLAKQLDGSQSDLTNEIINANTAMEALQLADAAGVDLAKPIAHHAKVTAEQALRGAPVDVEVIIVSRAGEIIARV